MPESNSQFETDTAQLRAWKPSIRVLFLDDGGVLNDNARRAPEWLRLIGEYMPPRLGGTAAAWSEANRILFPKFWPEFQGRIAGFGSHREMQRDYDLGWIDVMCRRVGVPVPDDEQALATMRGLAIYVAGHARADIDGAVEAVLSLENAGYTLHMASGTASWELRPILTRMGIREAVGELCGPDLIDNVKHGAEFYRRVFAYTGVDPAEALVVESSARCCGWAAEAGARVVRVDCDDPATAKLASVAVALV